MSTSEELWAVIHSCRNELEAIETEARALRTRQLDIAERLASAYEQLSDPDRLIMEIEDGHGTE